MNPLYKIIIVFLIIIAVCSVGYLVINFHTSPNIAVPFDSTPQNITLSGTYVCLPHADTTEPQTAECAFGLKTESGEYYAVNFGASQNAMNQFQSNQHIKAEGFVVMKEALNTDQWAKYTIKGIFTITKILEPAPADQKNQKLNIDVVCESALAYMSFPDAASAQTFVAECKAGKHPEVIERYKADMNLGDGAAI